MSPPFPLPSDRETELLRASVLDAALTLGPNVTNLIFADGAFERSSKSNRGTKILYIPDIYPLSPSAAAGPFSAFSHDTTSESSFGSNNKSNANSSTNESDEYSASIFVEDFGSQFVIISKESLQGDDTSLGQSKKGIKNFIFSSRKPQQSISKESSPERKRLTISTPRRLHPALDDPVAPLLISMPTAGVPSLSRASSETEVSPNSAQSTPIKPRKRIQRVGSDDQMSVPRAVLKPEKSQDEDFGYVSDGAGLSSFKKKFRRKGKSSTGPGSQTTSRNEDRSRERTQDSPSASVPLPIAERFVRKKPLNSPRPTKPPPLDNDNSLPSSSFLIVDSPQMAKAKNSPMSDKSFVMVPDLNVMKRLGLDKYVSGINTSGEIGTNNAIKLQLMEMLLKDTTKDCPPPESKRSGSPNPPPASSESAPAEPAPVPTINVLPPPVTPKKDPSSIRPGYPSTTSPIIRGKHSPFPTKPIFLLNSPATSDSNFHLPNTAPLRFKLPNSPPERYKNIDLPRSVRSSYAKDLEREEEEASLRARHRTADVDEYNHNVALNSPSVYSSYFDSEAGRRR